MSLSPSSELWMGFHSLITWGGFWKVLYVPGIWSDPGIFLCHGKEGDTPHSWKCCPREVLGGVRIGRFLIPERPLSISPLEWFMETNALCKHNVSVFLFWGKCWVKQTFLNLAFLKLRKEVLHYTIVRLFKWAKGGRNLQTDLKCFAWLEYSHNVLIEGKDNSSV